MHPTSPAECLLAAQLEPGVRVVVDTLAGPRAGQVVRPAWRGRVHVRLEGRADNFVGSYRVENVAIAAR